MSENKEKQVEPTTQKEAKTYTQAEVDELIKERESQTAMSVKSRYDGKYVKASDHQKLQDEFNTYKHEKEIVPKVKKTFISSGGNEKAFDSFYKLNKDALSKDKDLSKAIKEIAKEQDYFFPNGVVDTSQNIKQSFQEKNTTPKFINGTPHTAGNGLF